MGEFYVSLIQESGQDALNYGADDSCYGCYGCNQCNCNCNCDCSHDCFSSCPTNCYC